MEQTVPIKTTDFPAREGHEIDLGDWPTSVDPICASMDAYRDLLQHCVAQVSAPQAMLYAPGRRALLAIRQSLVG